MLRRTPLRRKGKSEVSKLKAQIQKLVRAIVIKRDGTCILRGVRHCTDAVLQADHLISRSNAGSYDDTRLIVCVCRSCHAWKSLGGNLRKAQYDALVRILLPDARVKLWERTELDSWRPKPHGAYDWRVSVAALTQELESYG